MSGPGCAVGGGPPARRPRRELRSVRRLEARPGSAAQGRRSQALRPLRHPPHRRCLRGCVSPRSPARLRRPRVPQLGRRGYCASNTFACNSPVTISVFELASLELQRFWAVFKSDRGKLRADLVLPRLCRRPRAPQPGPPVPPAAYTPVARGVLCVARRIGATSG